MSSHELATTSPMLPLSWSVLSFSNTDKRFYFGASFDDRVLHDKDHTVAYSIFLTDFSYIWHCDVDKRMLAAEATAMGFHPSATSNIYRALAESFSTNFTDGETHLELVERRIDHSVPLEVRIVMTKRTCSDETFSWEFGLTRLPESTTVGIIHNLFFLQSTVSFGLMQYQKALVKEIERKDNLIRILMENMTQDTATIVNNGSNKRAAAKFDYETHESEWKAKTLPSFAKQDIWDVFLKSNVGANTGSFSSRFVDTNMLKAESKKRSYEDDQPVVKEESRMIEESPRKKSRPNMTNLTGSFKEELKLNPESVDLKPDATQSAPTTRTASNSPQQEHPTPLAAATAPRPPSPTPSPNKEKKRSMGFGVSHKRKAYQGQYSPIKAAKR